MYNQIIHIDGADKTGKDHIKDMLVKRSKGTYLVYARSFISQIVYSRLYNRNINEEFFWERFTHANKLCDERFFLFTCSVEEAAKRFKAKNELDIPISKFEEHQNMFKAVANEALVEYDIQIEFIDTSEGDEEKTYKEIQYRILKENIQFCNECKLCSREINKPLTNSFEKGSGKLIPDVRNFNPKFLIVGMNPSNKRIPYTEHPFAITEDDKKNEVFINILRELKIYDDCILTNSVKCSTEDNKILQQNFNDCLFHLKNEIEIYDPKYLIALGNDVYHKLFNSGIFDVNKIIQIYHPSYQYSYKKIDAKEYLNHVRFQLSQFL